MVRSSSLSSVAMSLPPEAPKRVTEGDGAAVGVHHLHVGVVLLLPRQHDRGEGLVDLDRVDVVQRQLGPLQHLGRGRDRPVSMVTGSTPARAKAWKRARGRSPRALAFSSLMISTAEAPSVICDEFPAVTLPSSLKAGFSLASVSTARVGPDALVGRRRSRRCPCPRRRGRHGDDLVLEPALGGGPGRPLVALHREGVEVLT